ncbi:MAG: signal peptidase I [Oscillospiraceae bacterium]|nr:signal peptidase I [Oscillospiraceae bacterium]
MEEFEEQEETLWQRRIGILVTVLLVLAVAFCLYTVIQVLSNGYVNIGGFMMFRVVTGSMEPTIPVGALLLTKETTIDAIHMDDIICFRTQEAAIWGKIVTHRVVGFVEQGGQILLQTQGDANLVADGYLVGREHLVGKVIWHTGDESILAGIFSFFTSKLGFLGCIVFPCLLLAGLILKDCVSSIKKDLAMALYELEHPMPVAPPDNSWENDPLCGMTQEEYNEMYERIRAELIEELMQFVEAQKQLNNAGQIQQP